MKSYLLTKSSEPHCLSCRAIIPYDQYINTFDKKWRLSKYKVHRENILWEREQSLMPVTVQKIAKSKEMDLLIHEKNKLYLQIGEIDDKIREAFNFIHNRDMKEMKNKFKYIHKCIVKTCNGYLNENFKCDICDIKVCKKCFIEKEENHECDPELVETCKLIRTEARPCPKCSEYISKISGCDQMFCTMCGTAFSWSTGMVESGTIHNPHAHAFFRNNPDALAEYMNNRNGEGRRAGANPNAGGCRIGVPHYYDFNDIYEITNTRGNYENLHRGLAEFRQYRRDEYIRYINQISENNEDIRYRFLRKEIDEKAMKSLLHARNKKGSLKKAVYEILISTTEIMENFVWSMLDITKKSNLKRSEKKREIENMYDIIEKLRIDTNEIIKNIYIEHNYKPQEIIKNNFRIVNI